MQKEKEPPFDVAPIRKIISDLLTQTADEVESEEIEIKSWCSNERELADKVAEACACWLAVPSPFQFGQSDERKACWNPKLQASRIASGDNTLS